MPYDCELREAYANVLHSEAWDFYMTTTYRIPRHDGIRAAGRLWDILSNKFEAERAFVAVEAHRLDGIHLHALSHHATRPNLAPSSIWKYLFKANGRSTVARPRFSSTALVTWYCSKYVTKGNCDFHFFGDPCAWG